MAIARATHLSDHAAYLIRPALAEAKLITAKHARDAVYVATLSEELRNIERTIATLEQELHLGALATPDQQTPALAAANVDAVSRIRSKSCELEQRLRRIEASVPSDRELWPGYPSLTARVAAPQDDRPL